MGVNQGQVEAWNGGESVHYVDHADRYDRQLRPFADALLDRVDIQPGQSVLDIGCGCGVTTLAAARRARSALGVDISNPLIAVARERAHEQSVDNVEFLVADAQTHAFAADTFDLVISQFGLMFFDDPLGAFANVRRSIVPGGQIAFIAWQGLEANEWVRAVSDAVATYAEIPTLGGMAGGPGMFAHKNPDEVSELLGAAGFTAFEAEPVTPNIMIAGGATVDEATAFMLGMGIVRGLLGRLDGDERALAVEAVRSTLADHDEDGSGVSIGAAGWLYSARNV
jgi:ubiquinone/menaquinone biosynthesis C-methylase UbiE